MTRYFLNSEGNENPSGSGEGDIFQNVDLSQHECDGLLQILNDMINRVETVAEKTAGIIKILD